MIEDYTTYTKIDSESQLSISDGKKMELTKRDVERIKEQAAKIGIRVIISRSDMEDA